jgi:hypothetical protein
MLLTLRLRALHQQSSPPSTPLRSLFRLATALGTPALREDPQGLLLIERRRTHYKSALIEAALDRNSV